MLSAAVSVQRRLGCGIVCRGVPTFINFSLSDNFFFFSPKTDRRFLSADPPRAQIHRGTPWKKNFSRSPRFRVAKQFSVVRAMLGRAKRVIKPIRLMIMHSIIDSANYRLIELKILSLVVQRSNASNRVCRLNANTVFFPRYYSNGQLIIVSIFFFSEFLMQ